MPGWTVFEPRALSYHSRLDKKFNSINVLAHKGLIDEKPKIPHFDHFLQSRISGDVAFRVIFAMRCLMLLSKCHFAQNNRLLITPFPQPRDLRKRLPKPSAKPLPKGFREPLPEPFVEPLGLLFLWLATVRFLLGAYTVRRQFMETKSKEKM